MDISFLLSIEWPVSVLFVAPPLSDLVCIDSLLIPDELNGSVGRNRAPGTAQIGATDDRSAVLAWLARYADSPATLASYRKESERLLLWCVPQRRLALSDLTHEDLLIYQRFLADPQPAERWVMAPGQKPARNSPRWRPLTRCSRGWSRRDTWAATPWR